MYNISCSLAALFWFRLFVCNFHKILCCNTKRRFDYICYELIEFNDFGCNLVCVLYANVQMSHNTYPIATAECSGGSKHLNPPKRRRQKDSDSLRLFVTGAIWY